MLEAVELPAGAADLATGLADVDGDDLTHVCGYEAKERRGKRDGKMQEKLRGASLWAMESRLKGGGVWGFAFVCFCAQARRRGGKREGVWKTSSRLLTKYTISRQNLSNKWNKG